MTQPPTKRKVSSYQRGGLLRRGLAIGWLPLSCMPQRAGEQSQEGVSEALKTKLTIVLSAQVMGRIDLAQEPSGSSGYSPRSALSTPRSTYSSPPTSSAGSSIRKAGGGGSGESGHVRACMDMSALSGMSSLSPPAHADGTPALRRTGSTNSAASSASHAPHERIC